jgi:hypothetical protein
VPHVVYEAVQGCTADGWAVPVPLDMHIATTCSAAGCHAYAPSSCAMLTDSACLDKTGLQRFGSAFVPTHYSHVVSKAGVVEAGSFGSGTRVHTHAKTVEGFGKPAGCVRGVQGVCEGCARGM